MGNGVSQDQKVITENCEIENKTKNTDNCNGINFSSEIKRPMLPDISKMDEDEAYKTVCSELDQALVGHYAFLTNPTGEKKPTLQQVDKLLEEQGFENPDLTDATQEELVKSYLQKKKTPQGEDDFWEKAANLNEGYRVDNTDQKAKASHTPPACKLSKKFGEKKVEKKKDKDKEINEVLLLNRAKLIYDQNTGLHPLGKSSPKKLDSIPNNMPPLDPIGIESNRWVRPDSLVAEEAKALKKYKISIGGVESSQRIHGRDGIFQPQVGRKEFDASKFAEANAMVKKDLDIYSETTYRKYKKSQPSQERQASEDALKRPQLSLDDLDLKYDPSMEALLAEIENEYQ